MTPIVLYHANCTDGFGAAFSAWCAFFDEADYVPVQYGTCETIEALEALIPGMRERTVYVLDFSFKRPRMDHLFSNAKRVVWLDHHKTAFEAYGFDEHTPRGTADITAYRGHTVVLDNSRSGALIAWQHFLPDDPVPLLIKCIDDRDRWVFDIEDSKALHAGLGLYKPWKFKDWLFLTQLGASDWERNFAAVVNAGATTLQVYAKQIAYSVGKACECRIVPGVIDSMQSYEAPWLWDDTNQCYAEGLAVNYPEHQSELGHELAVAGGTFGLVWWYDSATGNAIGSLRSNGDYDVSRIAQVLGGGGHKNAAGFQVPMGQLLSWMRPQ